MDNGCMSPWRQKLHEVIFEADTKKGRYFDILLIWAIVLSVAIVMFDSMPPVHAEYGVLFYYAEWFFTLIFTIEYVLRLLSVSRPALYATSFFGVVDLLAVLPTYLSLLFPGTQYLIVVRILRVLRIFRVLKMIRYLGEANLLMSALRASRRKILVFLSAVMTLVIIIGAMMYLIEGEKHGFNSIPRSVYWAVVTITTVGFGDLTPQTALGQALAVVVMVIGYAIIAVPTGIITSEMAYSKAQTTRLAAATLDKLDTMACPGCGTQGHDEDAKYCKACGANLQG